MDNFPRLGFAILSFLAPLMVAATENSDATLETIYVTARHRAEPWQDSPITVRVIDADQREQDGAYDIVDHLRGVPGVFADTVAPQGRATSLAIRGIQYGSTNPAGDPSVALFIDGVYQSQSRVGALQWFDVERVQVIKGPQVALLGRNAFAGAIQLQTNRPEAGSTLSAMWRIGSHGRQDWSAVANGPVPGTAALARLAVVRSRSDGPVRSIREPGERLGGEDVTGARLSLALSSAAAWTVGLKLERLEDRSEPTPVQNLSTIAATASAQSPVQILGQIPSLIPNGYIAPPHHSDVFVPDGQQSAARQDMAVLTLENPTLVGGRFTGTASYQSAADSTIVDPAGEGDRAYNNQYFLSGLRTRSLDARWVAQPVERLHLLVGAHYLDDDLHYGNLTYSTYALLLRSNAQVLVTQRRRSSALFAELEWQLSPDWRISVAGRQMWEDKAFSFSRTARATDLPPAQWLPAARWDSDGKAWADFSPRLSLDWRPRPEGLAYLSWTKGFKSGGYTVQAANLAGAGPYAPEHVRTIELGYKHHDADMGLDASIAVFDNELEGLQRTITRSLSGVLANRVVNAASAFTRGIEVQADWRPRQSTTLHASLMLLDAGYRSFCANIGFPGAGEACGTEAGEIDNSALPLSHAPAHQWALGLRQVLRATQAGVWSWSLDAAGTAPLHTSDTPYAATRRQALLLLDGGLRWESAGGHVHAGLNAYNLLDEAETQQAIRSGNTLTVIGHTPRRRLGLSVGLRW